MLLDDWGADVAVIGPQKALAWSRRHLHRGRQRTCLARHVREPGRSPRLGALAAHWKEQWVDSDKATIPGTPSPLEILALEAALERVRAEGMQSLQTRHRASAAGVAPGRARLGSSLSCDEPRTAAVVADTASPHLAADARAIVAAPCGVAMWPCRLASGDLAGRVVRIDHTGQRAPPPHAP